MSETFIQIYFLLMYNIRTCYGEIRFNGNTRFGKSILTSHFILLFILLFYIKSGYLIKIYFTIACINKSLE